MMERKGSGQVGAGKMNRKWCLRNGAVLFDGYEVGGLQSDRFRLTVGAMKREFISTTVLTSLLSSSLAIALVGCGGDKEEKPQAAEPEVTKPVVKAAEPAKPKFWSDVLLHAAIREVNPGYSGNGEFQIENGKVTAVRLAQCGVTNITPLTGMELVMLDLQACPVQSIEALAGMPLQALFLDSTVVEDISPLKGNTTLQQLYVDRTNVKDISPLKGMPISVLNLVGTRISDLSALSGMPLRQLWLTDCKISDVSALAQCPMESLTLHRTQVADLSPLSGMRSLQRLHIGETPVSDVSPLAGLPLQRLVFTPGQITEGIEVLKAMPGLQKIGTAFEDDVDTTMPPAQFWQKYDAGEYGGAAK